MDYRAELVRLLADATQPPHIIAHFVHNGLHPLEIDHLLREVGLFLPRKLIKHDDGISEERRRELQELSTSDN